jgi:hypothetical protein
MPKINCSPEIPLDPIGLEAKSLRIVSLTAGNKKSGNKKREPVS